MMRSRKVGHFVLNVPDPQKPHLVTASPPV